MQSVPKKPPFLVCVSDLPCDTTEMEINEMFEEEDIEVVSMEFIDNYCILHFKKRLDLIGALFLADSKPTIRDAVVKIKMLTTNDLNEMDKKTVNLAVTRDSESKDSNDSKNDDKSESTLLADSSIKPKSTKEISSEIENTDDVSIDIESKIIGTTVPVESLPPRQEKTMDDVDSLLLSLKARKKSVTDFEKSDEITKTNSLESLSEPNVLWIEVKDDGGKKIDENQENEPNNLREPSEIILAGEYIQKDSNSNEKETIDELINPQQIIEANDIENVDSHQNADGHLMNRKSSPIDISPLPDVNSEKNVESIQNVDDHLLKKESSSISTITLPEFTMPNGIKIKEVTVTGNTIEQFIDSFKFQRKSSPKILVKYILILNGYIQI